MKGYRKILIAVNGSKDVLKEGIKIAQDEGCWVTVVKVIPPYEGELNLTGIKDIEDVLMSRAKGVISDIKDVARSEGALIKTRVETGEASKGIIEAAEEEGCDLIILGASRKKGLRRLFGDNVVRKVIDHAPCPVLVVKG